ncbi:hypothetical protein ATPR_1099 [Acetobacter tropicalis NBRC 101654]|uniref:Uncharacterized protein n=1 Tax=Acetobacter tropicalis NBRC 101654 TaxID=749388 RepID=F7VCK0_9PROT|nr:hypothetical protein ATPR_1099 [Acetobacter tropicalis NBRC 101654]
MIFSNAFFLYFFCASAKRWLHSKQAAFLRPVTQLSSLLWCDAAPRPI